MNFNTEAMARAVYEHEGFANEYTPNWDALRPETKARLLGEAGALIARYLARNDEQAKTTEYGWVIERGDSQPSAPTYYTGGADGWSQDSLDAIRFSRKQDAEKAAYHLRWPNCRIAEHGWG